MLGTLGILALALASCGSETRQQRAIRLSKNAFRTAQHQGLDLHVYRCLYAENGPEGFSAIVVWPTDSSVRAAFRHCNPAITQDTPLGSYVELSPEGDVIAVQGIVDTP